MGVLINIFKLPELRRRVLFTLAMLAVYRFGVFVAVPGVDRNVMSTIVSQGTGGFLGYFNMFSGGALMNLSVFALGIMPYISASIIMQLMTVVIPRLEQLQKEGETGRRKINQYSRYGTVGLALIQGYFMASWLEGQNTPGQTLVLDPGLGFKLMTMLTLTAGTCFLMWLGEQITERGIGNGISLIIFAGIVARLPNALYALFSKMVSGEVNAVVAIFVLLLFVAVVVLVIFEQQGQRKIPVNYAKRVVGRKMYGAQNTYIPFKINPSGVIPVIFASSLLTFPLQIAQSLGGGAKWLRDFAYFLRPEGWWYNILYVLFIVFFAYFYTQVSLNPQEISKNIRENGGSIPGIRSEKMEEYLSKILNRIVLPGALYLALIALIPTIVQRVFNFPSELSYLLGGTSLLILVGVDLDTMSQVEAQLKMHHHDGLTKRGHIKSRNL